MQTVSDIQEMSTDEIDQVEGGILPFIAVGLAVALAAEIIHHHT